MEETKPPFIIKCISEQCTVVHVGAKAYTASQLDDEINSGSDFGKKLKKARDELAAL
jgi:hypothetical protein